MSGQIGCQISLIHTILVTIKAYCREAAKISAADKVHDQLLETGKGKSDLEALSSNINIIEVWTIVALL
jgi:hypothetical protein